MKLMRIFPEMCASTRWLLWSSTRNIALGSTSITVPSTSIAASFLVIRHRNNIALYPLPSVASTNAPLDHTVRNGRQHQGTSGGHGNRVLELG